MIFFTNDFTEIVYFDKENISDLFSKMKELKLVPSRYQNGWQFDDSKLNEEIRIQLGQALFKYHSKKVTQSDINLLLHGNEDNGDYLSCHDEIIAALNRLIQEKHSTSIDVLLPTQKDVDQEINQQVIKSSYCCICDVYFDNEYPSDVLSYSNIKKLVSVMDPDNTAFISRDCFIKEKYWMDDDTIIPPYSMILDCKDDFDGKMFIESNVFDNNELEHIERINLSCGPYDGLDCYAPNKDFDTVNDHGCHDLCYSVKREGMPINDYIELLKKVDSFLRSRSEYVSSVDEEGYSNVIKTSEIPENENMFVGFDDDGEFNIYG